MQPLEPSICDSKDLASLSHAPREPNTKKLTIPDLLMVSDSGWCQICRIIVLLGKFPQIPSHQKTSMKPPAKLKAMTQPCLLVGDITNPVCELSTGTRICNFGRCRSHQIIRETK